MPDRAVSLPPVDVSVDGVVAFQPDSLLGTVVAGRYRLAGHLASGGMAAVYVAEDTRDRREVALKVLRPDLAVSPDVVRRFLCEGSIASMIDHENVVRVLDHGGSGAGPYFIAMELLEGEGLFDRLRRRGALPPSEVVSILGQVCDGLEAAHRQGVIHRDLKPENVFLHGRRGAPPVVKILDFGVASAANAETGDAGFVVGTPEYLSPEQAFGKAVDARADIYSVGVMAWRMLVGRTPFTADSADSMIRMQAREPVPPLTEARPDLAAHPDLVAAVARACAKDPDERPASAEALAEELARTMGHLTPLPAVLPMPTFHTTPPGSAAGGGAISSFAAAPPAARARPVPPDRGNGLRIAAVVLLVVGLVAGGTALHLHSRPAARAERLLAQGLDGEASALLAAAAEAQPGNAHVRALLGRALFRLGQPAAALDAYEGAYDLEPSAIEPGDLKVLANALTRRGAVAERSARLLARVGAAAASEVLAAIPLTSGAERVRAIELAVALDPGQRAGSVASWSPLLDDPDCDVRRAAVRKLGDSGDPSAIPALQGLAGLREGRPPPGVTLASRAPSVCGALEAGEALARLQSAAARR
jgi:eukaryotic-like serine/threonine-protein kinase